MADLIERYKITANLPSVLMNYCNRFNSKQLESITEMIYELGNSIESADVQPVDRWTSIEESKPKDMQQVLAVVDGDVREAFYNAGCFIGSNFYRSINEVKWWQSLPEPPKDGEHND